MSENTYRLVRFSDDYNLSDFDCGHDLCNSWLREHAASSIRAGVCAVYLLVEPADDCERVVGYFAINPTQVASSDVPSKQARGDGKVIIVDPDDSALVAFYVANGFRPCAVQGILACYLKVSTARALLG